MDWLFALFSEDSVAHMVLVISLVVSIGLALGRIKFFGIQLGIAGVLFSGLIFGHFGISINAEVMHFLREFGLILFVYAIGLQVGPGFVNSFFQQGVVLNALAGGIVIGGALIALIVSFVGDIPMAVAVGLFSGATTNTPSLAAAQEILGRLPELTESASKMPGLGYAVAYPFGIVGIIVSMLLIKKTFRIDIQDEADHYRNIQQQSAHIPVWKDLMVENHNLYNLTIGEIPFFETMEVVVTRIMHDGQVTMATPETRLLAGDAIRLVGAQDQLEQLKLLIGPEAQINLKDASTQVLSRRFVVTNKEAVGQSVSRLRTLYGVIISRIHRPDVEFSPSGSVHIHFGDELNVVGTEDVLRRFEEIVGNSLEQLDHPQIVPIFIGITLGVLLGSWPLYFPGIPSAVKLGLAGGPLIVAIVLSRIGNWGTMTWHLPKSSNIILKDIGIVLFLACVGLHSGDQFLNTLIDGDGFYWMACAVLITLVPLLLAAFVGRYFLKVNFLALCGLLAGSMTDPPALAFANSFSASPAVSIAYATVYPLVMILRIISAQLLVLLFI